MARKNPLPAQEKAICERLRQYREIVGFSRVAFAHEIDLDSAGLANYEYSRAPLRCDVVFKLLMLFRLNPVWLATGVGFKNVDYSKALLTPLKEHPRALFSEIYFKDLDDCLKAEVQKYEDSPKSKWGEFRFNGPGHAKTRLAVERFLQDAIKGWIPRVPSKHLNSFMNELIYFGESKLESYPSEDVDVQQSRIKRMTVQRMKLAKRLKKLGINQL
jgi:hypothetical protein